MTHDESARMARYAYPGITTPADEAEAAGMELTPVELSGLVDLVTAQIEYHERELARLECIVYGLRRINGNVQRTLSSLSEITSIFILSL
jgi:hypothetical protein